MSEDMTKPDTLIAAARKLSGATGIPWAPVSRIYSSLQGANLLPTSVGRRVWHAKPEHIATLLIGVTLGDVEDIPTQVKAVSRATPNGRHLLGETLHSTITTLLSDQGDDDCDFVVGVNANEGTAFLRDDLGMTLFMPPDGFSPNEQPIQSTKSVRGYVIKSLARGIAWDLT